MTARKAGDGFRALFSAVRDKPQAMRSFAVDAEVQAEWQGDIAEVETALSGLGYNLRPGDSFADRLIRIATILSMPDDAEWTAANVIRLADAWIERARMRAAIARRAGDDKPTPDAETRSYVKLEQAEKAAQQKWKTLRLNANRSGWAREIGCGREMVPKLSTWKKAQRWRTARKRFQRSLPSISAVQLDGLADGDEGILDQLIHDEEREQVRRLSRSDRDELWQLVHEQAMDYEPSPVDS